MALIGNDFIGWTQLLASRCSECGKIMRVGSKVLASVRNGKVKKKVCGEDCRQEFDARFWDEAASKNRSKR